jgi:plasmid stabilization system protein ParE
MTVVMPGPAGGDLDEAFAYYHSIRPELAHRFIAEFRRGIDLILSHPHAWAALDAQHRRFRLRKFPYGIIYRLNMLAEEIEVVAIQQLQQEPNRWRGQSS